MKIPWRCWKKGHEPVDLRPYLGEQPPAMIEVLNSAAYQVFKVNVCKHCGVMFSDKHGPNARTS